VALIGVLLLAAIPLYVWRYPNRPGSRTPAPSASASSLIRTPRQTDPREALIEDALDGGVETKDLRLGRVWIDRCFGPGA